MTDVKVPVDVLILDQTEYDKLYQAAVRQLKRTSDPDKLVRRAFPIAAKKTAEFMADHFTDFVMRDPNIKQAIVDHQLRGALGLRHSQDIKTTIFRKSKAFFKVSLVSASNGKYEVRFVNENAMTDVAKNIYYVSKRSYLSPFSSKRTKNAKPQKINWFEWLLRPSEGKITGYSVWPGLNGSRKLSDRLISRKDLPIQFLQQMLEDAIKKRSRSGTHIMLFGGNFAIKNWVTRKRDINIDKEYIIEHAPQAKEFFRNALIEQIQKYGVSRNVTQAGGGAAVQLVASKESGQRQIEAREEILSIIAKAKKANDLKTLALIKDLAKKQGIQLVI